MADKGKVEQTVVTTETTETTETTTEYNGSSTNDKLHLFISDVFFLTNIGLLLFIIFSKKPK